MRRIRLTIEGKLYAGAWAQIVPVAHSFSIHSICGFREAALFKILLAGFQSSFPTSTARRSSPIPISKPLTRWISTLTHTKSLAVRNSQALLFLNGHSYQVNDSVVIGENASDRGALSVFNGTLAAKSLVAGTIPVPFTCRVNNETVYTTGD